jgi:hypothetical protein
MVPERLVVLLALLVATPSCAATVVEEARGAGGSGEAAATSGAGSPATDASAGGTRGSDATTGEGGAAPPPVDAPGVVDALCPQVADESMVCIGFINGLHLAAIGLDTGMACPLSTVEVGPYEVSIATVGTDVLYCDAHGVVRAPLTGGEAEHADLDCGGVFNFDGGIGLALWNTSTDVLFHDSWEDLAVGNSTGRTQVPILAKAYASFGATIWMTESIALDLYGFDPPDIDALEVISLGDDPGSTQGLAVVDESTIVFGHPFGIHVIDRPSGQRLREVDVFGDEAVFDGPVSGPPTGLSCYRPR